MTQPAYMEFFLITCAKCHSAELELNWEDGWSSESGTCWPGHLRLKCKECGNEYSLSSWEV